MKKCVIILMVLLLIGCDLYTAIPHVEKYYAPTQGVKILSQPPSNFSTYFGTLKVVPRDGSLPTQEDLSRALEYLKAEAAKYGANYIYIRNYDPRVSDFEYLRFLDVSYGDGAVLEAELYR